jgi:SAM-dependent methyltransferase
MMMPFGADYADAYDWLYGDKDYQAECDTVERIIERYGRVPTASILDLGCGTGGHAIQLARRGYRVTGIDRSEEMLRHARAKGGARSEGGHLEFLAGDIRDFDLEERFDAALMMFAVAGYLHEDRDLAAAFATAGRHLRPGGLLLFDFWYGPAVMHQRPGTRSKRVAAGDATIVRTSSSSLDPEGHLCAVDFHLQRLEGERQVAESRELHTMRFFFSAELEILLRSAGFELLRLGAFPEFDTDPDETTWNAVCVGRRYEV